MQTYLTHLGPDQLSVKVASCDNNIANILSIGISDGDELTALDYYNQVFISSRQKEAPIIQLVFCGGGAVSSIPCPRMYFCLLPGLPNFLFKAPEILP
jgi:hypothetical protein